MKRKNLSIMIGFILSFSMLFVGVPAEMGAKPINSTVLSNVKASLLDTNDVSVVVGDVLIYQYTVAEQGKEDADQGIVNINIRSPVCFCNR